MDDERKETETQLVPMLREGAERLGALSRSMWGYARAMRLAADEIERLRKLVRAD